MLNIVISLISGIILSLAFPRANLYWLAWVALFPIIYYTYNLSWKKTIISGMLFSVGFFASLLYWIAIYGKLPWIALAVFQGLFILAFIVATKAIGTRLGAWGRMILPPCMWVVCEWGRSLGMFGFTWGDLGYSQYKFLPIVQISSIAGVWGVSFLLVLFNASLANLLPAIHATERERRAAWRGFSAVLALVIAVLAYGYMSLARPIDRTGAPIRVAVIQGNISQDIDDTYVYSEEAWRAYESMTLLAASTGVDLVVWPETVVPGYVGSDPYVQHRLAELASAAKSKLLVGGLGDGGHSDVYNSVFLIGPGTGILGRYSKVHLVPFGEFVPARKYMPFLQYYMVRPFDVSPGLGYNLTEAGQCRIGTAICFESTFPDISRQMTERGADVLCVVTDDEWFGRTAAAEQHMAKSVLRAAENGRYLIRSASSGISVIIDPRGRILCRAGLNCAAVLKSDIRPQTVTTFYTRHGDWLIYISIGIVFVLAAIRWPLSRWRKNNDNI